MCTTFPAFRAFGMAVAVLMLISVWLLLTRTRIGLVIQASLTHPEAVESLGHNVPRVFMLVFGGGTALAALAGVIGGALRVTEPSMALTVGAVVFAVIVIGGMGSLAGAFVASVRSGRDRKLCGQQRPFDCRRLDRAGHDGHAGDLRLRSVERQAQPDRRRSCPICCWC